ncbi:type VII toxin-antitoxin system HepT family RNase toxin [Salinibaculum salinum]|uniref:type VII toxin-antitoxin system HepT family RNase toxin n=1 Tax=Salinibaculum salinum TaxID=3131996 RepID=UPI0030EDD96B
MTVPDDVEARIVDKTEHVEKAVTVLSRKQSLDIETYASDREQRAIVEREFQTAIEACIDIAALMLRALDASIPETNAGQFAALEEHGILSTETSERMQQAAGFRNVLTHRYGDEIDNTAVYQHLQHELEWLVRYLREIRESLDEAATD